MYFPHLRVDHLSVEKSVFLPILKTTQNLIRSSTLCSTCGTSVMIYAWSFYHSTIYQQLFLTYWFNKTVWTRTERQGYIHRHAPMATCSSVTYHMYHRGVREVDDITTETTTTEAIQITMSTQMSHLWGSGTFWGVRRRRRSHRGKAAGHWTVAPDGSGWWSVGESWCSTQKSATKEKRPHTLKQTKGNMRCASFRLQLMK